MDILFLKADNIYSQFDTFWLVGLRDITKFVYGTPGGSSGSRIGFKKSSTKPHWNIKNCLTK